MVVRPWTDEIAEQKALGEAEDRVSKVRQKIPWDMPRPIITRVTARYEALGAARVAVETEIDHPRVRRYRFGPLRWEVVESGRSKIHIAEEHRCFGPTLLGRLTVIDWIIPSGGGKVAAEIINCGLETVGTWHWGEQVDLAATGKSRAQDAPKRLRASKKPRRKSARDAGSELKTARQEPESEYHSSQQAPLGDLRK